MNIKNQKVTIRLTEETKIDLKIYAAKEKITMQELIESYIEKIIKEKKDGK